MTAILFGLFGALGSALRTRSDLILENLARRQQLAIFKHRGARLRLTHFDRLSWIALSRVWSRWRKVLVVVKPETVVGWHRWALRRFWTWRSRHRQPGRPPTSREMCDFIKRMAAANEGWGAPHIHGELLKFGIVISEREVSRLSPPRPRKPPSQTWRTFLDNHVGSLASIDFFTVPTASCWRRTRFSRARSARVRRVERYAPMGLRNTPPTERQCMMASYRSQARYQSLPPSGSRWCG